MQRASSHVRLLVTVAAVVLLQWCVLIGGALAKDRSPAQFRCPLCEAFVDEVVLPPVKDVDAGTETTLRLTPQEACKATLNGCSFLLPALDDMRSAFASSEFSEFPAASLLATQRKMRQDAVFEVCRRVKLCVANPRVAPVRNTSTLPDVKISMSYGGRGTYQQLRLTLIDSINTTRSQSFQDAFLFNGPFSYRWTEFTLRTTLVNVTAGQPTVVSIGDGAYNMTVNLPLPQASVRGVLIADPCYSSRFIACIFGDVLQIQPRLGALLSSLGDYNNVDYWGILGDNFYDRDGSIAPPFLNSLSDGIKSKIFVTIPGNHDFWTMGSPNLAQLATDSNGNGFMQYYGQDVLASLSTFPYNLSVDPDKQSPFDHYARLPNLSNFFFYHHIGTVGFIGFSGAHFLHDMMPSLVDACAYMQAQQVSWVLLVGHWNTAGDGSLLNMTTNNLYHTTILSLPGCAELGTHRIKYLLGHTHCNEIDDVDRGFMVGGFGMGGGIEDCGDFGIPYLEATPSQLLITYFPITHRFNWWEDQYDQIMSCIQATGLSGCRNLGRTWLNVTI